MADEMRKANRAEANDSQVEQLGDDGRGWCGIRTYITGPAVIHAGHSTEYKSNVSIDSDPGCRSSEVDEVVWTITDAPAAFKDLIHVSQQSSESCRVKVEHGVQSGTKFTLHAIPKGHAVGKGTNPRVICQVNKADAQVVSVS